MSRRASFTAIALAFATSTFSSTLAAQLPIPRPSLVAGVSNYDFGGPESSGKTAIGALRVSLPLVFIIAEGSLGVFRPTIGGDAHTVVIPELQAQWQLLPILFRPYVGAGIGWFRPSGSQSTSEVTYSASLGVRAGIPVLPFGLRAELRHRIIGGDFDRHADEVTLGISW